MGADLVDALDELNDLDDSELEDELADILGEICNYVGLMKLIIAICERSR